MACDLGAMPTSGAHDESQRVSTFDVRVGGGGAGDEGSGWMHGHRCWRRQCGAGCRWRIGIGIGIGIIDDVECAASVGTCHGVGSERPVEFELFATGSDTRLSRRPGSGGGGRERWPEQMEVRISEVVERPSAGYDHRVGMAQTQHRCAVIDLRGQHIDPEHQVLGAHAAQHRRALGTTGAPAQPFHRRRP